MCSHTEGRQATTATVRRMVWRTAISPWCDLVEDRVAGAGRSGRGAGH